MSGENSPGGNITHPGDQLRGFHKRGMDGTLTSWQHHPPWRPAPGLEADPVSRLPMSSPLNDALRRSPAARWRGDVNCRLVRGKPSPLGSPVARQRRGVRCRRVRELIHSTGKPPSLGSGEPSRFRVFARSVTIPGDQLCGLILGKPRCWSAGRHHLSASVAAHPPSGSPAARPRGGPRSILLGVTILQSPKTGEDVSQHHPSRRSVRFRSMWSCEGSG